ncbi:MAG: HAD family hydrolase [Hyphomicrobiales bacterium]
MNARLPAFAVAIFVAWTVAAIADPLPSWRPGATKDAIIKFVSEVTDPDHANYVTPSRRVATFDNDGCLWAEQPIYFQLQFAFETLKRMAKDHPEWKEDKLFNAALTGDMKTLVASGKEGLMKILAATHAGMTVDEFRASVSDWIGSTKHPRFERKYSELIYQPMRELLSYLRENGFDVYIVSGGGIEFMRVFAEQVYGVPPQNVIGSSLKSAYEVRNGTPVIVKQPKLNIIDDKEGKPVGINQHIGKRPIFAAGNSDGDFQMLEYTTSGDGPRFGLIVHHTDAEREWAYDRDSHIGRLDRGLDEAGKRGWTVVDMKRDWRVVFPHELE